NGQDETARRLPGVIGYMNEVIGAAEEYRKVVDFLLSRTLLVDTLDHALSAAKKEISPLSVEPTFIVRNSCGCGFSNINVCCTSQKNGEERSREELPDSGAAWTEFLVKRVIAESGSRSDAEELRAVLGGIVMMVCRALYDPDANLSLAAFRQAIRPLELSDAYHETLPSVFHAVQYFLMSLMKDCPDTFAPRLIHFAQRVQSYTIHSYDASAHEANDRQKKRLRFISSMAREVLQQEDKVGRLWHKLFYTAKNLKLGNLWIFSLDDPHPMNPNLDIEAPWEEMKLVGWHVARQIKIFEEKERPETWRVPADHFRDKARSIVYFPLFAAREIYGIMAVEADLRNLPTLFAIAIQTGTALQYIFLEREQKRLIRILDAQSKEYEQKATQDELTGLLNRFGFIRHVDSSIAGHAKERAILAFADLDHLKHINDTLGHAAGDAAITKAADLLRQGFGDSALIGRMGGDEFVVFSCLREGEEPQDLLDRVRALSAAYNEHSRKPYYVEISLGITEFRCDRNVNLSDLLGRADDCLYEAKQKRRTTSIRQK
ncbi:MAG: diguanylate cyclase, partial [Oscillospiraceae bacterium]|nr:diguanylate cyclase [Oscillospiraceae bacterium]